MLSNLSSTDTQLFIIAYILRLFLVFCGDIFSPEGVKYQDIDYEVFTNASRHIYNKGIAFDCDTYRYTPLLAWILQPNIWLHSEFGKLLFITLDIAGAYLVHHIIQRHLQNIHKTLKINSMLWISVLWLFNPMVFTISSRGSCDSITIILVLLTLYFILNEEWYKAGIVYGAAVHFRIYPFIYAFSFVFFITHLNIIQDEPHKKVEAITVPFSTVLCNMLLNVNVWSFGLMSLFTFMSLNTLCYKFMGGDLYIKESYVYHFNRIDDQHNFSPFFYFFRLSRLNSYDSLDIINNCFRNVNNDLIGYCIAPVVSRSSFIPQLSCIIIASCLFYKNLHFSLFITTYIFVTWNKVCTSQYFTWYICLLPMVLPFVFTEHYIGWNSILCGFRMDKIKPLWYGVLCCVLVWFGGNGNWLYWAYQYEIMRRPNRLFYVFLSSAFFWMINNVLIFLIGEHYDSYPLFFNYIQLTEKKPEKKKKKKRN